MASFDAVSRHLGLSLVNHSPEEVVSYLQKWARPGQELRLMLSGGHVQYPSASDLGGRRDEDAGIALPWIFNSVDAADQFCTLVEEAFRDAGARCSVLGRVRREPGVESD